MAVVLEQRLELRAALGEPCLARLGAEVAQTDLVGAPGSVEIRPYVENKGIEHYLAEVLPTMANVDTNVVTNIGGESVEEFVALARTLGQA